MSLKEQLLSYMLTEAYKPLSPEELAAEMGLKAKELAEFWPLLAELEESAAVIKTRFGKYGVPSRMNLVVGILSVSEKGFGFVIPEIPGERDVYIPEEAMMNGMHRDRVVARVQSQQPVAGRAREGEIIRIVRRANTTLVGTFDTSRQYGFVIPDDSRVKHDIFVRINGFNGARNGQKVVVEIIKWPDKNLSAEGQIIEVLGNKGDLGIEILSIIKRHSLPTEFPPPVEAAAAAVSETIAPDELIGRRDLRHLPIVTVDSEDAKDLDDAIHVEQLKNGNMQLGVHIADVSYYVKEDSQLDREARERGTSVYLVDRVLPMLPQRLSNGICSLNAGADRLTLSIHMEIDGQGRVVSYEIFPSVIKVHTRLSYNLVRRLLEDKDEELNRQYFYLLDKLAVMEKLCHILRGRRMHRGAIDFDFPEIKVKLDAQGKPVEIIKRVRTIAESIIEEFMLVSNETVAEHMQQRKYPFIFRVHEEPDGDKMVKLNNLLNNFGQTLAKTDKIQPKALQKILARIAGLPEERIISMVMLRSLKQARYDAENLGHFGLAASFYTHFTSPIRRYPDLIVHRLLWESFQQTKLSPARRERLLSLLPEIALHSSQRERGATEAERETVDLKKVEYMAEFIGEEFSGTISGVTAFGLFVELDNGIEGLVHVSSMDDDYYHFSEERYSLVGGRTGKTFQLGEQVKVILNKVNAEERTIDFSLTGEFLSGKIRSKGINNKPNSRPPTKPAVNPPGKQKAATPRWKKRKNVTKPRTK